MKILLAGILGAIAMFIWTAIAHMALPLGEAGIAEIPNESAVLSTMQSNVGDQTGLYIFPGMGVGKNATRQEKSEAMKTWMKRSQRILLVFSCIMRQAVRSHLAKRSESNSLRNYSKRFSSCFCLHKRASKVSPGVVGFVLLAGILAAIATNVSYWNWYGFPGVYTANYMFIQVVGFLCVGIVAALVLRKPSVRTAT